ncbi:MAG: DUF3325 domain-containing protein [Comamonas sp.]|jgi:hypothetical protein|uniref:DUF3325 domain-containing protein n=1 Tax=Comamonas sp. TaxID=34028 RepID=UPI002823E735|nr:DUF3325 domain-containing protein [Comamonas sp.]MDR0215855.1 DUF3325 domain-containing protein [Comamonas sp.]
MSVSLQTGAHLGILAVSCAGFFALALATERHAEHLLGRLPALRWRMLVRTAGWLLLAVSLAWSIDALGTGIGIALWLGWLSIAALAWVFMFPLWPWQPPARAYPPRKEKASPSEPAPAENTRTRRMVAAGLLAVTMAGFSLALARVEVQPLKHPDVMQGAVGPWSFTFAEADRGVPEIMEMDVPMKEYHLRFCEVCDSEIRQAYLKVNKPRSARAVGMGFMGQNWTRRVEIPLPSTTQANSELWLTVVGKDGTVHQTTLRLSQASPATVVWFDEQRKDHASY